MKNGTYLQEHMSGCSLYCSAKLWVKIILKFERPMPYIQSTAIYNIVCDLIQLFCCHSMFFFYVYFNLYVQFIKVLLFNFYNEN